MRTKRHGILFVAGWGVIFGIMTVTGIQSAVPGNVRSVNVYHPGSLIHNVEFRVPVDISSEWFWILNVNATDDWCHVPGTATPAPGWNMSGSVTFKLASADTPWDAFQPKFYGRIVPCGGGGESEVVTHRWDVDGTGKFDYFIQPHNKVACVGTEVEFKSYMGVEQDGDHSFVLVESDWEVDGYPQYNTTNTVSITFTPDEPDTYTVKGTAVSAPELTDSASVNTVKVGMTAYRPLQSEGSYAPYQRTAVSDEEKVDPGVGIRINAQMEAPRNLIEVSLSVAGPATSGETRFLLRREIAGSGASLAVFTGSNRSGQLDFSQDTPNTTFEFQGSPPEAVWVEWQGESHGTSTLAFEVHPDDSDLTEGEKLCEDEVLFQTFKSIVIALGGWGQNPPEGGAYDISVELYQFGYDAQMFNEDAVNSDGYGSVYDEIKNAVFEREVHNLALFGYSWGGGSTANLTELLNDEHQNEYALVFSGYIDAIQQPWPVFAPKAETRRPAGSQRHRNYYQKYDGGVASLIGEATEDTPDDDNINVTSAGWLDDNDDPLDHWTIQDDHRVQAAIRDTLMNVLSTP